MSQHYIQVDTDGDGKKIDSVLLDTDIERQVVAIGSSSDRDLMVDVTTDGELKVLPTSLLPSLTRVIVDSAAGATIVFAAAGAGAGIVSKLWRLLFVADADCTVRFEDSDGTDLSGPMPIYSGGSLMLPLEEQPWFASPANKGIKLTIISGTPNIGGMAYISQA